MTNSDMEKVFFSTNSAAWEAPYVISKCKLKQLVATTQAFRMPKSDNIKYSKDVEPQEFVFISGGNAKWYSYAERQFGTVLITCSNHMI